MNSGEYWVMYSCCVDNCTMPNTLSYSFMNPKPSTAEDYDTIVGSFLLQTQEQVV